MRFRRNQKEHWWVVNLIDQGGSQPNRIKIDRSKADFSNKTKRISEWTNRFEIRLLGLPLKFRGMLLKIAGDGIELPAVVTSNNRLREFLALDPDAREEFVRRMLLQTPDDLASMASMFTRMRDTITYQPLQHHTEHGMEQFIFAARRVASDADITNTKSDIGEVVAALKCLDPLADIGLLVVKYYFYHTKENQFLLAQKLPYPTASMMTLEEIIKADPYPKVEAPLNQHIKVALRLAEELFFLHTAGSVNKNITSSSVIALRRPLSDIRAGKPIPDIEDTYLMCFNMVCDSGDTGTIDIENHRSLWDVEVFQHPEVLQ
ncbi:hypothetical protein BJ878DRAFT_484187 [Calycina marina]|uniref:Protein kinase domain-containing protein n=1 Tax=Calycina marina TaxID=1763456 RepID=A0A9P7YUR2_9HELO|nr:hypothetical protein BJ878DRAFT_484187 [Calycina marina]